MRLDIDRTTARPIYTQIAEQIKTKISTGVLPNGTRLPTVRRLASDLGVTRMTVQSAYQTLQSDGWTESQVGRGTFVTPIQKQWQPAEGIGSSLRPGAMLQDLMQIRLTGQVRSMISAEPDPALFPTIEFNAAVQAACSTGSSIYQYAPTFGDPELRVLLARRLVASGIDVTPDDMMLTTGATQALSLVATALTNPGDTILVETPGFLGFNHIIETLNLRVIEIPLDAEGPTLSVMQKALETHKPRFFFTVPDFHNPTGSFTSLERRHAILKLLTEHQVPLVEDSVYTRIAYDGPPPPCYRSLSENVIHINGFSKWLLPGLRIGYVIARPEVMTQLSLQRHATDSSGPLMLQRALAHFLLDGGGERHLQRTLPIYRRRRDAALRALRRYMPTGVSWSHPSGGFAIWLTLPTSAEPISIYRAALQQRLALFPGEPFFLRPPANVVHFRLCFGRQTETAIDSCIAQLADIIRSPEAEASV